MTLYFQHVGKHTYTPGNYLLTKYLIIKRSFRTLIKQQQVWSLVCHYRVNCLVILIFATVYSILSGRTYVLRLFVSGRIDTTFFLSV